ncbi:MAG: quinolinate synthase NadA [Desulfobaccales bacterium]
MPQHFRHPRPAPPEESDLIQRISAIKAALGPQLLILTHHYQRYEIVALGDYQGDSFALASKSAADHEARFIVFCGVYFMAEAAAILAQPHQVVQIPDPSAGCLMADMADIHTVAAAWEELTEVAGPGAIAPIVYMNSDADLKAFCGRHGGVVCTSSNAGAALTWGLSVRDKVFFFPDQHLGRNTGNRLGLAPQDMIIWRPGAPLGGNRPEDIRRARLILWDGYCHVHTHFQADHVLKMRQEYPEARIVVHPECTEDVVALADAVGSTGFIAKYVADAPPQSTIIIGTEINLVHRLALNHPDKQVLYLHYSLCPNMFKINQEKLLWTLENLGQANQVVVPEPIKTEARLALDRMLTLTVP